MKKDKINMLEAYKYSKRRYQIMTPATLIAEIITALVMFVVYPQFVWIGFVCLGLTVVSATIFFFIHKYLDKKIAQLTKQQENETNIESSNQ